MTECWNRSASARQPSPPAAATSGRRSFCLTPALALRAQNRSAPNRIRPSSPAGTTGRLAPRPPVLRLSCKARVPRRPPARFRARHRTERPRCSVLCQARKCRVSSPSRPRTPPPSPRARWRARSSLRGAASRSATSPTPSTPSSPSPRSRTARRSGASASRTARRTTRSCAPASR